MSTEAGSRPNELALCHQVIEEQQATIDALHHELEQVKHFIEQLLKSRHGPRSERVDPNQRQLFDPEEWDESDGPAPARDQSPDPPVVVGAHRRRGGGRKSLPEHLPRDRRA